jgi:RNA polymerase sigma-70 factor (ECF subfamily)
LDLPPPFEEAVKGYEREIMRFLMRSTGDREDSLDLFQETWLRAYRSYPTLKSHDGLRPWLYRIAGNLCRNRARDRMRRLRVIAGESQDHRAAEVPAPWMARSSPDGVIHLKDIVARLPGKQGRALVMRKFGGFEYEEIATALGCSPESARAGVYQALKKLRAAR